MKKWQWRVLAATAAAAAISIGASALAAQAPETFTATATVKTAAGGGGSAPVTITINRFTSDAERDKLVGPVKANDAVATRKALTAMEDIGFIQVGQRKTPIKYAYARSTGGGRMVTVVTAQPILHLGGSTPTATPKEGYDLALALLILDARNTGDGELAPAVKIKVNESGAVVTDDYGTEVVRLVGIAKAK
jgi:hypothetical protein